MNFSIKGVRLFLNCYFIGLKKVSAAPWSSVPFFVETSPIVEVSFMSLPSFETRSFCWMVLNDAATMHDTSQRWLMVFSAKLLIAIPCTTSWRLAASVWSPDFGWDLSCWKAGLWNENILKVCLIILQMLPWSRPIYDSNEWLMREKAGNPIGPPKSNIWSPTLGPKFQHLVWEVPPPRH